MRRSEKEHLRRARLRRLCRCLWPHTHVVSFRFVSDLAPSTGAHRPPTTRRRGNHSRATCLSHMRLVPVPLPARTCGFSFVYSSCGGRSKSASFTQPPSCGAQHRADVRAAAAATHGDVPWALPCQSLASAESDNPFSAVILTHLLVGLVESHVQRVERQAHLGEECWHARRGRGAPGMASQTPPRLLSPPCALLDMLTNPSTAWHRPCRRRSRANEPCCARGSRPRLRPGERPQARAACRRPGRPACPSPPRTECPRSCRLQPEARLRGRTLSQSEAERRSRLARNRGRRASVESGWWREAVRFEKRTARVAGSFARHLRRQSQLGRTWQLCSARRGGAEHCRARGGDGCGATASQCRGSCALQR